MLLRGKHRDEVRRKRDAGKLNAWGRTKMPAEGHTWQLVPARAWGGTGNLRPEPAQAQEGVQRPAVQGDFRAEYRRKQALAAGLIQRGFPCGKPMSFCCAQTRRHGGKRSPPLVKRTNCNHTVTQILVLTHTRTAICTKCICFARTISTLARRPVGTG